MPKVGDVVEVNNQERTVIDIKTNKDGNRVICWESNRGDTGVCMLSIWHTWQTTGKDGY